MFENIASNLRYKKNSQKTNIEDFIARRTRLLLLDRNEALRIAPVVAEIMAQELGKDEAWQKAEVEDFTKTVAIYL